MTLGEVAVTALHHHVVVAVLVRRYYLLLAYDAEARALSPVPGCLLLDFLVLGELLALVLD
ncbi:hypothetical protein KDK_40360 [Dictyobacter kobayashii]|uniref:Uncharacterized protein n=1 Tax=Dictyobacter kobayashii TaxID=2014872 RepID=A0A402AM82_9CHLR|nr:hypothetical protein KDK_40360 [Dictyobacter kobayashii]